MAGLLFLLGCAANQNLTEEEKAKYKEWEMRRERQNAGRRWCDIWPLIPTICFLDLAIKHVTRHRLNLKATQDRQLMEEMATLAFGLEKCGFETV